MATKNTKQKSSPNFILASLSLLIKLALFIIICLSAYLVLNQLKPELSHKATRYLTTSVKYAKLMTQEPPTDNSLPNPLINAHLTDTWGAARSGGRSHEGIDIFAKRGTPIHSTTEGIVRKVGTNSLGGNVVSIIGPGGVSHYYAHLESYADIEVGDWVYAGDIIGYVGDSGNAKGTPPHLHYGVYTNAGAVNPYPLLIK